MNELYALYVYSIIFQYYARESWLMMDFQYVKENILNVLNRHIMYYWNIILYYGITWKIIFSMNWNVLNSIEILQKLTVWQLGVGSDTRNHSWSFISSNEWGQMNELCIERRPQLTISIPCQDGGSNFLSGRPSIFFLRAGLL